MDIGERSLLPAVRKAGLSTVVMADGFSCKEQIQQTTPRQALHLAEVLQMGIHPENASPQMYPEAPMVRRREETQRRSMVRAGITMGLVFAGAALLWSRLRARS
jgi:hypothetical protein